MRLKRLFIAVLSTLLLTGCNSAINISEEHSHTYLDVYLFDEHHHWLAASCGHADAISKLDHSFVETTYEPTTEHEGYTLHSCTVCDYSYITDITARLPHYYEVVWLDDNNEVIYRDSNVQEGTTPIYRGDVPVKENGREGFSYYFDGWDKSLEPIFDNATYKAVFKEDISKYTVKWVDENGDVLEVDENVEYGTTPTYDGEEPLKDKEGGYSYLFDGWDQEIKPATKDITYRATFIKGDKNIHRITWKNDDGTTLYRKDYRYGDTPSYNGPTPSKEGNESTVYLFSGWSSEIEPVTEDKTYTACYQVKTKQYTITWIRDNGSVMKVEDYDYGDTPTYSGTPTKRSDEQYTYEFDKWYPSIKPVTGDTIYRADFTHTINVYRVRWYGRDNELLQEDYLKYGELPAFRYNLSPSLDWRDIEYTYTFGGEWFPEIQEVTGDIDYHADYLEKRLYSYDFNNSMDAYIISRVYDSDSTYIKLPSEHDGLPVVGIKKGAFDHQSKVQTIEVPDSFTEISEEAFEYLDNLEKVVLPSTIKKIGYEAFKYCESLKTINIPDSVEIIDDYAFIDCKKLESIILSDAVTYIGEGAFYGCENLKNVHLPDHIETIKKRTFSDCTNLKFIDFPKDLKTIEDNAFAYSGLVGEIFLPEGLERIEEDAFYNIYSVIRVTLPSTLSYVDKYAFFNCKNLTTIVDLTSLNLVVGRYGEVSLYVDNIKDVFTSPQDRLPIYKEGDYYIYDGTVVCYDGNNTEITDIPSTATRLADYLFYKSNIVSVTIPGNITTVGNSCFSWCQQLETVSVQAGVETIGEEAFEYCSNLKEAKLSNGIIQIGTEAFYYCTSLDYVRLPNTLKTLESSLFSNCTSLKRVTIPRSVTKIESSVFSYCESLEYILIPGEVTEMSFSVFFNSNKNLVIDCVAASKPDKWYRKWNYYDDDTVLTTLWDYYNRDYYEP